MSNGTIQSATEFRISSMRTERFQARLVACVLAFLAGMSIPAVSTAADEKTGAASPGIKDLFNQADGEFGGFDVAGPKLTTTISPSKVKRGQIVTVVVKLELQPTQYTYPLKAPSGATTSSINIDNLVGLEPIDKEFKADKPYKVVRDTTLNVNLYKHIGGVTWTRKYRVDAAADLKTVSAGGTIDYQVCDDATCKPTMGILKATAEVVEGSFAKPPKSKADGAPSTSDVKIEQHPLTEEVTPSRSKNKPEPVKIKFELTPANAKATDIVTLKVTIKLEPHWHAFAMSQNPKNTALPTTVQLYGIHGLQPVDDYYEADKPYKRELTFEKKEQRTFYESVTWTRRFQVLPEVNDHKYGLRGTIRYQVCKEGQCRLPLRVPFALGHVPPASKEPVAVPDAAAIAAGKGERAEPGEPVAETETETKPASQGPDTSQGLLPFLIAAAAAGFVALLTPCVFPMIPITVSFFLKQAEKEHHRPMSLATIYCLGIMGTFTALGLLMAAIFGPASINKLANDPWLNLAIAGVLIFFGMNLLGLFEIRIPSALLTWSSGKETQGGVVGVLFMALTFTLVSFTCTFAFAGGLLVWAAKGEYYWPILGMLAFSAAFSLPFFFLALFPSMIQKLPKSGGWMNTVKVTMGMIECGAAFKFLSVTDLSWNPEPVLFDYATVMSAWIVIAACTGVYLLGLFRLSHDTPSETISPIRLAFAMMFLGFAGFLAVGLFAPQKPTGKLWEQIEAFAPPTFSRDAGSGGHGLPVSTHASRFPNAKGDIGPTIVHHGLEFALDYEQALKYAEENKLPVFFDFTGVNCVNCRRMELVMAKPVLRDRLTKFVLVQLYVDNVPTVDPRDS
eukprot:g26561.t1